MSRSPKLQQVDYFPHMCKHGQTLFIVEQRYGNDGYAFWFKLLELLGSRHGHYLDVNQADTWEFLQARTRLSAETCNDILDLLAKLEAIDKELWVSNRVVWSQNLVDNLTHLYKKRAAGIPQKPDFGGGNAGSGTQQGDFGSGNTRSSTIPDAEIPQRTGQDRTGKEREGARGSDSETPEPKPHDPPVPTPDPCALADHTWQQFRSLMPLRGGRFDDEDACRATWTRSPAMWNQWLAAVRHYAASAEVRDGALCFPMRFLSKLWKRFQKPEEPLGHSPPSSQDHSWKAEADEDERAQAEFKRKAASGEIKIKPRDRLSFESEATYQEKLESGKIPMVQVMNE
ncbi:MAG: DUF4373 domain-containing protein [Nitrospirae bacterium]|nr:DUF4373 domain-containing protein [Nitrospirota bacterium]